MIKHAPLTLVGPKERKPPLVFTSSLVPQHMSAVATHFNSTYGVSMYIYTFVLASSLLHFDILCRRSALFEANCRPRAICHSTSVSIYLKGENSSQQETSIVVPFWYIAKSRRGKKVWRGLTLGLTNKTDSLLTQETHPGMNPGLRGGA